MKRKAWKRIPLLLVSFIVLTSCKLLDNIVNTILATVANELPILVNVIDLMDVQGDDLPLTQFEEPPLSKAKQADIQYIRNALIIPKKLAVEGFPYNVEFRYAFNNEAFNSHFKEIVLTNEDLPAEISAEIPLQLEVYVLIPVGTSDILAGANSIEDLQHVVESKSQSDLIKATNQDSLELELNIYTVAGDKEKHKRFYLNLKKAEFGAIVIDELFESNFLLNVYDAANDEITSLETKPTEQENATKLEYFKETLAIPKRITIDDIGEITFEVTSNYPAMFFENELLKTVADLDPDNDEFSGDVAIHTFTPVGDSQIPHNVATIDDFKSYIEDDLGPKELYNKATTQLDNHIVTFTVSAFEEDSDEAFREETYYFKLMNARLEQEIVDYAMGDDVDYIVNLVHYNDIGNPIKVDVSDNSASNPYNVSYLTETIVIPKRAVLTDFGAKTIEFDVSHNSDDVFESERDTDLDSADVSNVRVTTLTPLGGYDYDAIDVDGLADEIRDLPRTRLYEHATHAPTSSPVEITVTAKMLDDDGVYKTKAKTYYFNFVAANVDKEIIDHIEGENALLNVVSYENTDTVKSIAHEAQDVNNRYRIEHLTDTIIIPKTITLPDFGDTEINVTETIEAVNPNFFITEQSRAIDDTGAEGENFDLLVKTFTPLGGYLNSTATTLEQLADAIGDLETKDLYAHSQRGAVDVDITLTLELGNEAPRTQTYYLQLVPADVDEKIGDAIMNDFEVVNIIHDFTTNTYTGVSLATNSTSNPEPIEYFKDMIIIPSKFIPGDYPDKEITFIIDFDESYSLGGDLYYIGEKNDINYDDQNLDFAAFLPIGGYVLPETVKTMEQLIAYIPAHMHVLAEYNDTIVANNTSFTITPVINGRPFTEHTKTYYFAIEQNEALRLYYDSL